MSTPKLYVQGLNLWREDTTNPSNNNFVFCYIGAKLSSTQRAVKEYAIEVYYTTPSSGGNRIFMASGTNSQYKAGVNYSMTAPESSNAIVVRVRPSKMKDASGKRKNKWSGAWTERSITSPWLENQQTAEAQSVREKISKPATPSISSATYSPAANSIRLVFSNTEEKSDFTRIRRYMNGDSNSFSNLFDAPKSYTEFVTTDVKRGDKYQFSVLAHNKYAGQINGAVAWSNESSHTDWVEAPPIAPSNLVAKSTTDSSVILSWKDSGHTGEKYLIAYSTDLTEITQRPDSSQSVQTVEYSAYPVDGGQSYSIHIDEGGKEWHFRVKRYSPGGWSDWSSVQSAMVGKVPSAPVTYATQPYVSGDTVLLRWAYVNSDGSEQQNAQVTVSGGMSQTIQVDGSSQYYELDISSLQNGTSLSWKVRCAGVIKDDSNNPKYGDYSAVKSFTVVSDPTLSVDDGTDDGVFSNFPLEVVATSDQVSLPVSYFAQIACAADTETTNWNGTDIVLSAGTVVWSKQIETTSTIATFSILPTDVQLENGVDYILSVTVNSAYGLSTTETRQIACSFADSNVMVFVSPQFEEDTISVILSPECYDMVYEDDEIVLDDDGSPELGELSDRTLSVWRADAYGNWELVVSGLENTGNVAVVDPYPTLGECVYRVVAVDNDTGDIDFADDGLECSVNQIVIDMDGSFVPVTEYDGLGDELSSRAYTSDRVILPTNIAISEESDPDMVELELWGDDAPTLRNGTHLRIGGSWSCSFYKEDNDELIAGLRRLMAHVGSVYVREPGGVGYWARCKVSMSRSYENLGIDVSITVTRVKSPNSQEGAVNA